MKRRLLIPAFLFAACCPIHEKNLNLLRSENLDFDENEISKAEVPLHALSYNEIIEAAVSQNLDLRVKAQEVRIKEEEYTQATWKMLPQLMFNLEQYGRNRNTGSSSQSLTNQPPAPPSISSEQHDTTYDITFTWNIIDFALAFNRARQEANRTVMLRLDYIRLQQNLILEVTKSYWKAQLALKGISRAKDLINRINEYQQKIRYYVDKGTLPAMPNLKMDAQLSKFKLQLQDFNRDYTTAKSQLAQFMGLRSADMFEMIPMEMGAIESFKFNWNELEGIAVTHRPELFGKDVEEKVFIDEVHNQALQLIPGLGPYGQTKFDSNKFLIWNHWLQAGLKITYNIFGIPNAYYGMKAAEQQQELVKKNRVALTLGVLTQIQLALLLNQDAYDNYLIAQDYNNTQQKLKDQAFQVLKVGEFHDGDVLSYESDAFLAEMTAYERYGNFMLSLEQINNSIGLPRYFQNKEEDL